MSEERTPHPADNLFSLDRCKALNDGVIAIVMTLLVLGINIPADHRTSEEWLLSFLRKVGYELFIYGVSFWLAAAYWVQNCAILHCFRVGNWTLVWLNLLYLFPVTLLPYMTQLKGDYLHEELVVVLFGGLQVLIGVTLLLLWRYTVAHPELLAQPIDATVRSSMTMQLLISPILISIAAMAVSYVWMPLSSLLFMSIPVYYFTHRLVDRVKAK